MDKGKMAGIFWLPEGEQREDEGGLAGLAIAIHFIL